MSKLTEGKKTDEIFWNKTKARLSMEWKWIWTVCDAWFIVTQSDGLFVYSNSVPAALKIFGVFDMQWLACYVVCSQKNINSQWTRKMNLIVVVDWIFFLIFDFFCNFLFFLYFTEYFWYYHTLCTYFFYFFFSYYNY